MFKGAASTLQLCNYFWLGRKSWTQLTFATSQRLVVASTRMCDLYIQTNDLVAGYRFAGDLDARVNETLIFLLFLLAFVRNWMMILCSYFSFIVKIVTMHCHIQRLIENEWECSPYEDYNDCTVKWNAAAERTSM